MIRIDLTPEQRREARSGGITLTEEQGKAVYRARTTAGRPKRTDVPRCPCGVMPLARAQKRGHKCDLSSPAA